MNTAHKSALILALFASGCAVDFSSGLSLDTFDKTPHAVDVSDGQGNKTVTCEAAQEPRYVIPGACSRPLQARRRPAWLPAPWATCGHAM
jgi:hypothetical protein